MILKFQLTVEMLQELKPLFILYYKEKMEKPLRRYYLNKDSKQAIKKILKFMLKMLVKFLLLLCLKLLMILGLLLLFLLLNQDLMKKNFKLMVKKLIVP
jgi:hypothetical protein